ncbi:uncharacterized protein LOC133829681 [Humulus lupulus]|uniref:uncharacterized protein LOC133829681 n=1 Tax=Humulus lupulus TaxID=3486 RepID=UPI002B402274|nr:uncharacterized protein LOC133829681 [Humulus lupulus]
MAELQKINSKMITYLLQEKPERWARPFFPTKRYNILTSNIVKSTNAAIVHARELLISSLIEAVREMLQIWFSTRKQVAIDQFIEVTKWTNDEMELKFDMENEDAIDAMKFQVTYGDRVFVVDFEHNMCTCNKFQLEGIRCAHAIATIESKYVEKYNFCSNWYSISGLKGTYAGSINHALDKLDWSVLDEIKKDNMMAPKFKVKLGRRKKKRIPSTGKFSKRARIVKCGNCGILGHNRKNCSNPPILKEG